MYIYLYKMKSLNDILLEYFSKRNDGGANFSIKSYDDLEHFDAFLIETGYDKYFDRKKLNELFGLSKVKDVGIELLKKFSSLWNKFFNLIKNGYRTIVSQFKSKCNSIPNIVNNQDLEKEFIIPFPKIAEPRLSEYHKIINDVENLKKPESESELNEGGRESALKGYYNEYYTSALIALKDKNVKSANVQLLEFKGNSKVYASDVLNESTEQLFPAVKLNNPNGPHINQLFLKSNEHFRNIEALFKDKNPNLEFENFITEVKNGSNEMANYIVEKINNAPASGTIVDIIYVGESDKFSTNADIRLKVIRNIDTTINGFEDILYKGKDVEVDNEYLSDFSLKLYQKSNITVASNTVFTVLGELTGKNENEIFDILTKGNSKYTEYNNALALIRTSHINIKKYKAAVENKNTTDAEKWYNYATENSSKIGNQDINNILKEKMNNWDKLSKIDDILIKMRKPYQEELQKICADVAFKELKEYFDKTKDNDEIKNPGFRTRLLKWLGIDGKNLNLLWLIADDAQKGKYKKITNIDLDPLTLKDLTIVKNKDFSIKISNGGKRITTLSFKEGTSSVGIFFGGIYAK